MNKILRKIRKIFYLNQIRLGPRFGRLPLTRKIVRLQLRQHFPETKILATSEVGGKAIHARNIIVSDAMNVLRRELPDYPLQIQISTIFRQPVCIFQLTSDNQII